MLVALCQGVLKLSVNLGAGRTELSANNVVMNEWNTLSVSRYMLCVCVCVYVVSFHGLCTCIQLWFKIANSSFESFPVRSQQ